MAVNWEKIARAEVQPVRLAMIDKFAEGGEWSAKTLAKATGCPRQNAYYHVRELAKAGVIKEVRTKPSRGSVEHFFVLA